MKRYRLRVRKEVEGLGEVTASVEVKAISKSEAKRQLKALVHTSWRWLEFIEIKICECGAICECKVSA